MNYLIPIVLLGLVLLSGCNHNRSFVHNGYESTQWLTRIRSQEQFSDVTSQSFRHQEFERVSPQMQFDQNKLTDYRISFIRDYDTLYDNRQNNDLIVDLYQSTGHRYFVLYDTGRDHLFHVYKDTSLLFSHTMTLGAESTIQEAGSVTINDHTKEFFTFYDYITDENGDTLSEDHRNLWFDGQTMNELYDLDSSSFLFTYNNKIGFVAGKDGKKFIIYDDQQVSEYYDNILTFSCCSIIHYPLRIDQQGYFVFLAQQGKRYVFVQIRLHSE